MSWVHKKGAVHDKQEDESSSSEGEEEEDDDDDNQQGAFAQYKATLMKEAQEVRILKK